MYYKYPPEMALKARNLYSIDTVNRIYYPKHLKPSSIFRDRLVQKKYNQISKVADFFIDTRTPSLYICRCFDTTQQHERE
jgi:hypothetical protein